METKKFTSKKGRDIHFFEITWEGCEVEVVEGIEDGDEDVFNTTLTHPRKVIEYVENLIATKRDEGYEEEEHIPVEEEVKSASNTEFEELIASNPHNHENYLVYADWLQTQGDPRGELIVVQNELQKNPSRKLKILEGQLLENYGEHFYGYLDNILEVADIEWHLGYFKKIRLFVESVSSYDADEISIIESVFSNPSTTFLEEVIFYLDKYEENDTSLYTAFFESLCSRKKPLLKKLQVGHPDQAGKYTIPSNLDETCPQIEELAVFCNPVTVEDVPTTSLKKLVLATIQNMQPISLISQSKWPKLETLVLLFSSYSFDGENAMELLFENDLFPQLKHLAILDFPDEEEDICARLADSPLLSHLETLNLSQTYYHRSNLHESLIQNKKKFQHLDSIFLGRHFPNEIHETLKDSGLKISFKRPNLFSEYTFKSMDEYEDEEEYENEEEYYDDPDDFRIHGYAESEKDDEFDEEEEIDQNWEEFDRDDPYDLDEEY